MAKTLRALTNFGLDFFQKKENLLGKHNRSYINKVLQLLSKQQTDTVKQKTSLKFN